MLEKVYWNPIDGLIPFINCIIQLPIVIKLLKNPNWCNGWAISGSESKSTTQGSSDGGIRKSSMHFVLFLVLVASTLAKFWVLCWDFLTWCYINEQIALILFPVFAWGWCWFLITEVWFLYYFLSGLLIDDEWVLASS